MRAWVLAVASVVLLGACGQSPAATSKPSAAGPEMGQVKATYGTASASASALWVAIDHGLFAKHGLTVEDVFAQSTNGLTVVANGEVQFFYGQGAPTFQAAASGLPLRLVFYNRKNNDNVILARPEIASPADLKGKALGINLPGDDTDLAVRIGLKALGVDPKEVTLQQIGNNQPRMAALTTGKIVATTFVEPSVSIAKDNGMHVMYDLRPLPAGNGAITVDANWAKANPWTVQAFLMGLVEAVKYGHDHKPETVDTLAKHLKLDPGDPAIEIGYETYFTEAAKDPSPDPAAANAVLDALKLQDPQRFAGVTTDQVIEPSYMKALTDAGFLKTVWGDRL